MENKQELDKVTEQSKKITVNILQEYIDKINGMEHYLELEKLVDDMVEELREKSLFTLVNGEKYLVIRIVKELIKYDKEFKGYELNNEKMSWIIREFHDSHFDFNEFENGVKKAMRYTGKYYEMRNYLTLTNK